MNDTIIFGVGTVVFLMLASGVAITILELRRLGQEAESKLVASFGKSRQQGGRR